MMGGRRRTICVQFFKRKDGTALVEFAIVSPIFLMMMFSLFEVGWFYYVNSIVDASVSDASRLIETGQIQKSGVSDAQKKVAVFNAVCNILKNFGDCDQRLTVDVQTFASFAALDAASDSAVCADASDADLATIQFDPGSDLAIVRVRICFLYSTVNPAIGVNLSEPGSGQRRLVTQAIFRNEPYSVNTGSGT
jgi:Flp pilus assembly protein TadG